MMNGNFLAGLSGDTIDALYEEWKRSADSVSEDWRHFFSGFELGLNTVSGEKHDETAALKQSGVQSLIYRYRSIGHLLACTDPLSPCQLFHPLLELSTFGLDVKDFDTSFACRRFLKPQATLREIVETLRETYCREIGVEFMHIEDPAERQWLIDRMEPCRNNANLSSTEKLHILEKLHQAALFESFLHRRFVGQKRFSLEGGEVLIPALDRIVTGCPKSGISDVVIGMSHRGRLNVLTHIMQKPYHTLFAEFRESISPEFTGDGDVKYHKGYSCDCEVEGHPVHLSLAANPSHLEAVNAVVEGKCRARQDRYGMNSSKKVLPVLIHGDAAFSGQGSVTEVLNMSQLEGYSAGGTIHIVLNNQIGFTTLPRDSRSTMYATDVAKMLSCPIFHVQGEAPEAALHVIDLAMAYRHTFHRDVVIELICYRRHGHNEGDEPAFTQPKMYQQIAGRPPVNRIYATVLADEGDIAAESLEQLVRGVTKNLEDSFTIPSVVEAEGFADRWSSISPQYSTGQVDTSVPPEKLADIARRLHELPEGFNPHDKICALMQKRYEAVSAGEGLDWGNAETLAYATLLDQGFSVRISGQDSQRGTFNHRHCVLIDKHTENNYAPLESIAQNGATFQAWNSHLSEFGVLGFEYGYSAELPNCLTLWEAQFGDFANGAQVIIDQFIASGETKWNRASGLVMLLPHGYEGQGAEHSSARIERYLQLCAAENIVVANPTTPAQMFHLLRRQMLQTFRKPLIVFTPKSLLRHPVCSSTVNELSSGTFQSCLVTPGDLSASQTVLFCSGKIFYELEGERVRLGRNDTIIVRIEQLYPLDIYTVKKIVDQCSSSNCRLVWVQEEPENMGAWQYMERHFREFSASVSYIGRPADACPAVGSHHLFAEQQADILNRAFYQFKADAD
jgi:2-oxoglutarate dehydrogenase E1 component